MQSILAAHRKAQAEATANLTDDASVAEHAGIAISMIPGRHENRKLTSAEDIEIANRDMMRRNAATAFPTFASARASTFIPSNLVTL